MKEYYKRRKGREYLSTTFADLVMRRKINTKEVNKIDIKSRYEVISDLESKKREFIKERDSFGDKIKYMKKEIKEAERELEDSKEDLKDFEKTVVERQATIKELIRSVEDSLNRFSKIDSKKL